MLDGIAELADVLRAPKSEVVVALLTIGDLTLDRTDLKNGQAS
jgi:hypothetical protein